MPVSDPRGARVAARLAAGLVFATAVAALAGWALDQGALRSLAPSLVAMNPATALAFLLAGAVLWLLEGGRGLRSLAPALGAALATYGAFELATTLLGIDAGLDRLFFPQQLDAAAPFPNRMAPNTALGFALAGAALVLLARNRPRPAQLLALAAGAIGLLAALGYLYGVDRLTGLPRYIPMALNTALAFVTLATGILIARWGQGYTAVIAADNAAGYLARRLLPVAFLLPPVLGALRLAGERAGFYGTEFGVAITVVTTIIAFLLVVLLTADRLDRIERRRDAAEAGLQRQAARIRDLYDRAPCGYHSLDEEGRVVEINETELGWLGYTREEVIGRMHMTDFLDPESRANFHERYPLFKEKGEAHDREYDLVRKDGTTFPVSLSATAVYDEEGRFVRSRSTSFDITERRRAAHAIQELNRELEAFSYSVSHDLRAPLRSVLGFAQFLADDHAHALDEEGKRLLDRIMMAARRMGQLIDDLLGLARLGRTELKWEPVDLSAIAREVAESLRHSAPDRDVEVAVADGLEVEGDPRLLRIVLENLMANAWKFTRGAERPRIDVGLDSPRNGGPPVFHVRDNGAGFDTRYAEKLFAPFQRLHRVDEFEGTGIGLATVQRILHRHGGEIWAEGEVGRGATFHFRLG